VTEEPDQWFEDLAEEIRRDKSASEDYLKIQYRDREKALSFSDIAEDAALRYILGCSQAFIESYPLKLGLSVSILLSVVFAVSASVLIAVGLTVVGIMLFAPFFTALYITFWVLKLLKEWE